MRKIREVLRLKHELGRSNREIATSLAVSHSTVGEYLRRASEAGVSRPVEEELDDERLEAAALSCAAALAGAASGAGLGMGAP